jgi:hypothetical protein
MYLNGRRNATVAAGVRARLTHGLGHKDDHPSATFHEIVSYHKYPSVSSIAEKWLEFLVMVS